MSEASVNLASRPFSNQAPVLRGSIVLGLVCLSLMVANAALYWSYFSGSGEEARTDLERVEQRIAALEEELRGLDREVSGYDLAALAPQVDYLNLRIAERSFGWSRLFEDLAEVLPPEVRLTGLSPALGSFDSTAGPPDVLLTLEGAARRDEALLVFIDNLFEHPRFSRPNPSREVRRDAELQFALTVIYDPLATAPAAADPESGDPEPGDAEPGDPEPGDAEPGDAEMGDAEPGDAEMGDAGPADAAPDAAEPGEPEGAP